MGKRMEEAIKRYMDIQEKNLLGGRHRADRAAARPGKTHRQRTYRETH